MSDSDRSRPVDPDLRAAGLGLFAYNGNGSWTRNDTDAYVHIFTDNGTLCATIDTTLTAEEVVALGAWMKAQST